MSDSPFPPARSLWAPIPAVVLLVVVAVIWWGALKTPHLAHALGLGGGGPFLDLAGLLAANEAAGRGLDPYALNPLDVYQRPLLYSTWWLWRGLTRADTNWMGYTGVLATLGAVFAMWRPRDRREAWVAALILLSPAWLLAIYRANNDLVIFVLLALAIVALQRSRPVGRAVAALLIGTMAILKYYPAAAVIGLFRAARRREALVLLAIFAGVVVLGWPSLTRAVTAIRSYGFMTNTTGLQAFGLHALNDSLAPDLPSAVAWLAGLAALVGGFRLATESVPAPPRPLSDTDHLMTAAIGGAVLIGCFAIGTSYNYKLVFIWFLLPWLMRDAPAALGSRKTWSIIVLLVFACWAGGVVAAIMNTLGPGWSRAVRAGSLTFAHGFAVVVHLAGWAIIGVCLRLALTWTRRQNARLATAP